MIRFLLIFAFAACIPATEIVAQPLVPAVTGPWIRIASNPDLGEYHSSRQQPVDFGVWQAADGTWQAWSCIRNTRCGGNTRLFYRWESPELWNANWQPKGIAMESRPELGEVTGGLQAPHVVVADDRYHMFYGDWNNICHATSEDGKTFQRVIQSDGTTAMFSEGPGNNTRDVMMLKVGDLWYAYYTAFPNDQCMVYVRTTTDFKTWSRSSVAAFGGIAGTGRYSSECPHVVFRHGRFYLFRTQHYGKNALTTVYHSQDPTMFGINQDDRYLATQLAVAAPEIVSHQGQDYLVALTPELDGLQMARLNWIPKTEPGEAVWDFSDPGIRQQWQIIDGHLPSVFTASKRSNFWPPQSDFIGTAEQSDGWDDDQQAIIQSPEFEIQASHYWAYLSGGTGDGLSLQLIDAESGSVMLEKRSLQNSNRMKPVLMPTDQWLGRRARLKVVDQAQGGWGHINFGGLYRPSR